MTRNDKRKDAVPALMVRLVLGDAIGTAFQTVFPHFRVFLRTQGVFVLIAGALSLATTLAARSMMTLDDAASDPAAILADLGPVAGVALLLGVASMLVSLAGWAVGVNVADGLLAGRELDLQTAWGLARPRYGNLLLTTLLVGLAAIGVLAAAVGAGFGLALAFGFDLVTADRPALAVLALGALVGVVLVLVLVLRWSVASVVSVLETRRVTENLVRSADVTRHSLVMIFLTFFVLFVIVGFGSLIVTAPFVMPSMVAMGTTVDPPIWTALSQSVASTAVSLATTPLITTLTVIVYRRLTAPAVVDAPPVVPAPVPPAP